MIRYFLPFLVFLFMLTGCAEDLESPTVQIVSPTHGSTVSGTISITAEAEDDVGVEKVEFYLNDTLTTSLSTEPYVYNWNTTVEDDSSFHTILARAYDAADNEGISSRVTVMVLNGVPVFSHLLGKFDNKK